MAAPALIPILKKVATVVVSDKKLRKVAVGIILGAVFLLMLPIIAILGIFSGTIDVGLDNVNEIIAQQQATAQATMTEIESVMVEDGYSAQRIEEAQVLFTLAFLNRGDEDGFVEKFVGCFAVEQTDMELITAVNTEFGTTVTVDQYTEAVQDIRDKYAEQEAETTQ